MITPINEKNTIGADWKTSINVQFGTIKEKNTERIALHNRTRPTDNLTMMANWTIDLMIVFIIVFLVVTLAESNCPYA